MVTVHAPQYTRDYSAHSNVEYGCAGVWSSVVLHREGPEELCQCVQRNVVLCCYNR